jgi:hypothetical protein
MCFSAIIRGSLTITHIDTKTNMRMEFTTRNTDAPGAGTYNSEDIGDSKAKLLTRHSGRLDHRYIPRREYKNEDIKIQKERWVDISPCSKTVGTTHSPKNMARMIRKAFKLCIAFSGVR